MSYTESITDSIVCGDVTKGISLPDRSVHCVITSPPYWGLRDYGVAGQLGLEKTPEEYIERMVGVFRHVWRVLRDDGTLWLNMGDSYVSGKGRYSSVQQTISGKPRNEPISGNRPDLRGHSYLKDKDLAMMPARLAIALQTDGWYLRSDIIWAKPNPMPESCTDRCTKSHEHMFLLTKKPKYFYDADAVREAQSETSHPRYAKDAAEPPPAKPGSKELARPGYKNWRETTPVHILPNGRNKRDVWTIPTQSFPEAHFATFPEKLVEPCIKAGASEKGCCPECGSPWVRVVEREGSTSKAVGKSAAKREQGLATAFSGYADGSSCPIFTTIGWKPTCECCAENVEPWPIPCTVYDPFMGSGTVGLVAYKLSRHYIGTELNPEYIKMAEKRIGQEKNKYSLIE